MEERIALGDRVEDRVTGFKGVAVSRTKWLWSCDRIGVQPEEVGKDGKLAEVQWFDEPQLKLIKTKVIDVLAIQAKHWGAQPAKTGGPRDDKASVRKDSSR